MPIACLFWGLPSSGSSLGTGQDEKCEGRQDAVKSRAGWGQMPVAVALGGQLMLGDGSHRVERPSKKAGQELVFSCPYTGIPGGLSEV